MCPLMTVPADNEDEARRIARHRMMQSGPAPRTITGSTADHRRLALPLLLPHGHLFGHVMRHPHDAGELVLGIAVAVNPFTGGASGLWHGRATSLGRFFMARLSPWHFYALICALIAVFELIHLVAGR